MASEGELRRRRQGCKRGGSRLGETENNRRREIRRRAIAAKIFSRLRAQGNYNLPQNCDNNEVLKALCAKAGWLVEDDGTKYRKGYSRPLPIDMVGSSTRVTPFFSQNLSPFKFCFRLPNSFLPTPDSPTRCQLHASAAIPKCDESDSSTIESGQWIRFQKYTLSRSTTPTSPTYNLLRCVAQQNLVKQCD